MKLIRTTILIMLFHGKHAVTAFSSISRKVFGHKLTSPFITRAYPLLISASTIKEKTSPIIATQQVPVTRRTFRSSTSLGLGTERKENPSSWTFDRPCETMEINSLPSPTLSVTEIWSIQDDTELVILGVFSEVGDEDAEDSGEEEQVEPELYGKVKELDAKFSGAIKDFMMENYKAFKNGATVGSVTPTLRLISPGSNTKRFVLLGLGEEGKDLKDRFFGSIGKGVASKCSDEIKLTSCSVVLPSTITLEDKSLFDFSTEFYSSFYSDNRYRTGSKKKKLVEDLKSVKIVTESVANNVDATAAIKSGEVLATGISLAKDIVNAPHNILNSESLANLAKRIAAESDTITCKILGKEECESKGMGAYLAVARGSETEPQFIHLTYTPKSGKSIKKIGVVGKGLLFDTGGYNIKVQMMELMKFDCGGSAAVFGAAKAIGDLAPENVEVHFFVAACENMINDRAMVPSDILTASNGKTIEVINTDAEGRLTLADALVYAEKEVGCESIIELSTLTGACMIALGQNVCGVWTSDDDLAEKLADASKVTGEKSWRMPLEKEYNEQLESKIADISNCGTRYGGAITAALFLQNFVSKSKFAHIDIAGPVWSDKIGATGFGTKLITEWIYREGEE